MQNLFRRVLTSVALSVLLSTTALAQYAPGAVQPTAVNPADLVEIIQAAGGAQHQLIPLSLLAQSDWTNGVNIQTGTSYTVLAGDMGKLVTTSNGGAIAVTLGGAGTTGFETKRGFAVTNLGVGSATITPGTGTICGAATLVLGTNRGAILVSDGTNWNCEGGTAHLSQTPATIAEGGTNSTTAAAARIVLGIASGGAGGTQSATTGLVPTTLPMTCMRTAAGLMMTASASGTNFGLTYTPATTAVLIGTATSSSTTGDTAACDFVLPPNYIAGTNITLKVGCYYTDSSSSATTHTMAAAAYLNTAAGLQGSTLIATAAQVCPITTSAQQTFTITGTTLVPGSYLALTFTAAVVNAGGASTEWLTSAQLN